MEQFNLLGSFIAFLHQRIKKRSDLVSFIADTLKIQKESASRRLNGSVLFSVQEMGLIASTLGISLDKLLKNDPDYEFFPMKMLRPNNMDSLIDGLDQLFEKTLKLTEKVCLKPAKMGMVTDSLPLEFCLPETSLYKFIFFKWEHSFLSEQNNLKFASWTLPEKLIVYHQKLIELYKKYKTVFYIWDMSIVWNLMKELLYFRNINLLENEDVELIKKDLHDLMNRMEKMASGMEKSSFGHDELQLYISYLNIGNHLISSSSDSYFFAIFRSAFIQPSIIETPSTCIAIRDWVNSMKKVSTLISESGEKERRLFFEEQHSIIENT